MSLYIFADRLVCVLAGRPTAVVTGVRSNGGESRRWGWSKMRLLFQTLFGDWFKTPVFLFLFFGWLIQEKDVVLRHLLFFVGDWVQEEKSMWCVLMSVFDSCWTKPKGGNFESKKRWGFHQYCGWRCRHGAFRGLASTCYTVQVGIRRDGEEARIQYRRDFRAEYWKNWRIMSHKENATYHLQESEEGSCRILHSPRN